MKKSLISLASGLVIAASLVGCDEKKLDPCPEKGADFFKSSIAAHYEKQGKPTSAKDFKLVDGASYNEKLNWWVVPFDLNAKRMNALLSCDGNLELTIPPQ